MTHWLGHYLAARYEDGARGPDAYDCWGAVREIRHLHLGCALLPSWGHVRNTMPREFTRAYREVAATMEQCAPEPGAVATVYRGALMLHVGVVFELEGRLAVFEFSQRTGARWRRVADFEAQYPRVAYYRDSHLPQQA